MVLKVKYIYYIFFLFMLLRITLYYYNVYFARLSDLIAFIISFFIFLQISNYYINKSLKNMFYWMLGYMTVISLSLLVNNFYFNLCIKDLFEVIRPIIIFLSISLGFYYVKKFNFFKILKIIVFIGILNGFIGLVEFFFHINIFYKLFSTPNLLVQHRAGGIVYSHVEYSLFNVLVSVVSLYIFLICRLKKYLIFTIFLIFTSFLSLSKAGILFTLVIYSFIFVFFFKSLKFLYKFLILFLFFVFIYLLIYFVIDKFVYFKSGFKALMDLSNTKNLSILNRIEDIKIVIDILKQGDYRIFIGSSPLRLYKEISYIEISFFNILFRFGLIGVIFYYFIVLLPIFIKYNQRDFLYIFIKFMKYISISLFLIDFTANASETIKFSFLLFFLYGTMLGLRSKYTNEKNTITNK